MMSGRHNDGSSSRIALLILGQSDQIQQIIHRKAFRILRAILRRLLLRQELRGAHQLLLLMVIALLLMVVMGMLGLHRELRRHLVVGHCGRRFGDG